MTVILGSQAGIITSFLVNFLSHYVVQCKKHITVTAQISIHHRREKMRKILSHLDQLLVRLDLRVLMAFVVGLVLLLGILDYVTGFEISFSFFYIIPIGIATWYLSRKDGLVIALLSSFTWAVSNRLAGETYSHEFIRYWNTGIRLSMFLVIVEILGNLRTSISHERSLSRIDFLTGIYNRREFYDRANQEILNSRRFNHPLTVAVMDVDSFKEVNDKQGHQSGDALLKIIAQTILSTIRKTDVVARVGGDEFALLFPNTEEEGAFHALEKVKNVITKKMHEMNYQVTFSFGAATFSIPQNSTDELLSKADQLMYNAKANGKNKIVHQTIK